MRWRTGGGTGGEQRTCFSERNVFSTERKTRRSGMTAMMSSSFRFRVFDRTSYSGLVCFLILYYLYSFGPRVLQSLSASRPYDESEGSY